MKKQTGANDANFSAKTAGVELPKRRRTENLPDDLCYFEDALETEGVLPAEVITGAGWLLELIKITTGEISFLSGTEEIRPFSAPEFAIFYLPFTITKPLFRNVKADVKGIAGTGEMPSKFRPRPFVFEADFENAPKCAAEVIRMLDAGRDVRFVEAAPDASLLSLRAKKLIDENYRIFPSIARIAGRLKVSHAHLARQFKHDFGLSPSAYLHQIRISDANFRLTRGEAIIDVSGEVGYNDLSRFYKHFRKTNAASPGFCRVKKS